MNPRRPSEENEKRSYLDRSLATGIFQWQEMAHLDFQDLIKLARKNNLDFEESECELDD